MQGILTSYNNIKARQTTAAIESRTITTKAGNGVIIEKWLQRSRGWLRPEIQGTRSPLQQDHNDQEPWRKQYRDSLYPFGRGCTDHRRRKYKCHRFKRGRYAWRRDFFRERYFYFQRGRVRTAWLRQAGQEEWSALGWWTRLYHRDGEAERSVCGMRLDAKGFSHWQCEGISVNILVRTKK